MPPETQLSPLDAVRAVRDWFLISGKRRLVTLVLVIFVGASLLSLDLVWPFQFRDLLTEEQTVQGIFRTLLSGVILLVSIVVSINSLVISQELAPIGSQHERVVESWNFRTETAETVGTEVTPAAPAEFLRRLLEAIDEEIDGLTESIEDIEEEQREELQTFSDTTTSYVDETGELVKSANDRPFDTRLFSPLYDPSNNLEEARQLRQHHALSDEVDTSIEQVIQTLQYFTTAREYFKTIYYKREFSRLSRDLLYTGLPSILWMTYMLLALDAQAFLGTTFGVPNLTLFLTATYVVALLPFLVLTSYILRAAVIAETTVTTGAFLLD
jgi:hypothetical protein